MVGSPQTHRALKPTSVVKVPSLERLTVAMRARRLGQRALSGRAADVLMQSADAHEAMDDTAFVKELRTPTVRLEIVRAAQVINYKLLLGLKEALDATVGSRLRNSRDFRVLQEAVDEGVPRIRRDLSVAISRRDGTSMIDGLTAEQIEGITPLQGLVPALSFAELAGYRVLVRGSGFGSSIQAKRQERYFGLTGEEFGGSEYLSSYGAMTSQIRRFIKIIPRTNFRLVTWASTQKASHVVATAMRTLTEEFDKAFNVPVSYSVHSEITKGERPSASVEIRRTTTGARRIAFAALGSTFLGLSIAGIYLPVLPSGDLMAVSSFFFARSFPRVDRWMRSNKILGPVLRRMDTQVFPVRAKIVSLAIMASVSAPTIWFGVQSTAAKGGAFTLLGIGAAVILMLPSTDGAKPHWLLDKTRTFITRGYRKVKDRG